MPIYNNLKELRTAHRYSQEYLADLVDVTRQTINSIENGKYIASLPLAFELAKVFNTTIEEIFIYEKDDE